MTVGLSHNWPEPKAPARVVVIGCRGFVGSAIVAELEAHKILNLGVSAAELDLLSPDGRRLSTSTTCNRMPPKRWRRSCGRTMRWSLSRR